MAESVNATEVADYVRRQIAASQGRVEDVDLTVYATEIRSDAAELEAMIQEHDDETRALVVKLRDLAEKLDATNALIDAFLAVNEAV